MYHWKVDANASIIRSFSNIVSKTSEIRRLILQYHEDKANFEEKVRHNATNATICV